MQKSEVGVGTLVGVLVAVEVGTWVAGMDVKVGSTTGAPVGMVGVGDGWSVTVKVGEGDGVLDGVGWLTTGVESGAGAGSVSSCNDRVNAAITVSATAPMVASAVKIGRQ